jgi:diguanylate cyclase
MKSFESLHKQTLKELHLPKNKLLFEQILAAIEPHCEEIVIYFYRVLLNNVAAIKFLNHDKVKNRVREVLAQWLRDSFTHQSNPDVLEKYYQYQIEIGHIHARIDLPMNLVDHGMSILVTQVMLTLKNSNLKRDVLADAMILVVQVLDLALSIIGESYERDVVINQKNEQSLKMHISTQSLAFDYGQLCTSLSDWMRNLLLLIAQNKYDANVQPTIRHSNFGLWISHKAYLFLAGRPELATLVTLVDNIDEEMHQLANCIHQQNEEAVDETLIRLNDCISQSICVLGNIAKDMIDEESGRDPLTHLFNRRYLETVMRHETSYSLEHGILFGALMIDIDHFKRLTASYGDKCDNILKQLAKIMTLQVRAGDFVFRLGGEKFLIVLADVNQFVIQRVAEKVRSVVFHHDFKLNEKEPLTITVSIGTAMHDRHPDFNRTLKLADEALYIAKGDGRNQVIAANQPQLTYGVL